MVTRRDPQPNAEPLPQRTLRNDISRVLRAAEAGGRFAITVNGRIVAELGPPGDARPGSDWRSAHAAIERIRARHADDTLFWTDIGGRPAEEVVDPWRRADNVDT